MAQTPRTPPQAVPKRRNVNIGGQRVAQREILSKDIDTQLASDVEWMLKRTTVDETDQQVRLGNEPTRFAVDSREGKPLEYAKRRTEVWFGDVLDQAILNAVRRSLMAEIRKAVAGRSGGWNKNVRNAMTSSAAWQWVYVPYKSKTPGKVVNPRSIGAMGVGDRLILRPRIPDIEYENMLSMWRDLGYRRPGNIVGKGDKGVNPASSRKKGQGFMAKAIDKVKRSQRAKNFAIYVAFTRRFEPSGSKFRKQGAPVIIIRATRKRGAYRRRIK